MKKLNMIALGVLSLGLVMVGGLAVDAANNTPDRPAWVTADGRADLSKMPDNVQIPYQCWNGKNITLQGKDIKKRENGNALPGSEEHKLGLAKMKELSQVPGVITHDEKGGEVITIDDNNSQIEAIMKKYEVKETPQCQ